MFDPGFAQPDLFSIPAAKKAELAATARGLLSDGSYLPVDKSPLAPLTRDVTRTPVEAIFTLSRATFSRTCQLTNAVSESILLAFGYLARELGTGSAGLMTRPRGQRTEAGR